MPRDYMEIGSAPWEEECVSVNPDTDYLPSMRAECNRFINRIREVHGEEPEGAELRVKSNSHDFGTYLEVVCYFSDTDEDAMAYAYKCQDEMPAKWANS